MKLNHINLFSIAIPADRKMFETYFGLRCVHEQRDSLAVLRDDGGMLFVLNKFGKSDDFSYPKDFVKLHVGFIQSSREDVDTLHARLKADGWETQNPRNFHGAYTFYF